MSNANPHGVMEGEGAYNRHARFQAGGIALALPLLEKAVRNIELDGGDQPVVIADYGSSQGKNSLAPVRIAIRGLRRLVSANRPIFVFHVDQAANDFNSLFDVLGSDPDRYTRDEPDVFPCAIGRSFYEQVLPAESVHVGWSSYAAVWLSRIPTLISGHFRANRGTEAERAAFQRQAAEDWEKFLSLRASELRPGGCLVIVLPALRDDGEPEPALEAAMEHANAVLAEMVEDGTIKAEERARMVLGSHARRRCDLLAPFHSDGQFEGLSVECCELFSLSDPAWTDYERDGSSELLAARRAQSFRATFAPSLASALRNGAARAFAERLEDGLKRRLANEPMPMESLVQTTRTVQAGLHRRRVAQRRAFANRNTSEGSNGSALGDLLHRQALHKPDAPALFCNDRKISYRELDESSTRLASWLIEQGLRPGDRVAIHWSNSIEVVQIFFAVFKAGLIAVPINLRLKAPEVGWILEHSQPLICFSEPALAPIAQQARSGCASLRCILTELPAADGGHTFSLPDVQADQPAVILYTSGSTARPKGVTHTHRSLGEAVRLVAECLLNSNDTALVMTQMMHVAGLGVDLLPAIYLGIPAVLLPAFEPGATLDAIERFRCTFTLALPALLQFVVEEQVRKPRDVSSLRTVLGGGDSVPVQLQERFAAVFGLPLQEAIGMTETSPIAVNPKQAIRPGSLGIAVKDTELGIVDAAGRMLGDGETGEIVVRSPANCVGYWNDAAATEALLRGGWLHTGDLASRDRDGYFWFKGRKKAIIIRAGSNISPQEVEEVLYEHPAVFEAGVVGAPDPIYGEVPVAFVSLRNGSMPGEQELREHARRSLADYKVPERILFIPELPKGPTGKVDRSALKATLLQSSK